MAEFTYGDQTVSIPKFKIREIRAAAPFIDRINARQVSIRRLVDGMSDEEAVAKYAQDGGGLSGMAELVDDLMRVIAVGVLHAKQERPYSVAAIEAQAELIEAEVGFDQLDVLNKAFEDITKEAGLGPKGPLPPPKVAGDETLASEPDSTAS